jgi:4-hydroxybutyrate CoA-transferase
MSWETEYSHKLTTAAEALRIVESGMRVFVHASSGFPTALVNALADRAPSLRDVEIVHLLVFSEAPTAQVQHAESFRHRCLFIGGNLRRAVAEGRADYVPIHLGETERLTTRKDFPIDIALIQVTPPDRYGYMSVGAAGEIMLGTSRAAKHVIAQVNSRVPRTCGESSLHVSEVDALVESSQPLVEFQAGEPTECEHAIARHVADLIEDGDTIQIGIGGVPDAILSCLHDRKDLGVHSEILSDSIVPLIERGVITGARKTLHPYKIVVGFGLGTRKFTDFVNENPFFEFRSHLYVNDPFVIARNDRMVAVNSALEVDLTGQVCSDSVGQSFYSGFGGQLDFIRGAARAKFGRPVIALPATARNGSISRIVPMLNPGAGVVDTRADVHFVATEFGVVDLWGKSVRERAELLIGIAHPSFRGELYEHCVKARWFQRNEVDHLALANPPGMSSKFDPGNGSLGA